MTWTCPKCKRDGLVEEPYYSYEICPGCFVDLDLMIIPVSDDDGDVIDVALMDEIRAS